MTSYDVIGDVHGHADVLEHLLVEMGYRETRGAYRHPDRSVIFVGDLIDRGPGQLRTLDIARRMADAGSALIVLGNHEFNAVGWATCDDTGRWGRPHTDTNRNQHAVFLDAVGEDSARHDEWIAWFRSLPMWLDLDGLRIVHACWHPPSMQALGDGMLTHDLVVAQAGDPGFEAIEVVLKGPEIYLGGIDYSDNDGNCREKARLRWWDPNATTLATAAELPGNATACDGSALPQLPATVLDHDYLPTTDFDTPVLYGHYWRSGTSPSIDNARSACLDWSVAKRGQLVAYRWDGETDLTNENFVAVR